MKNKNLLVVGGLIVKKNKILICQRSSDNEHSLKWEFPGGKVKKQEEPQQALKRELNEELKITIKLPIYLCDYMFEYQDLGKKVSLFFFLINEYSGEISNTVHNQLKWIEIKQLSDYDFLEGDHEIIKKILKNDLEINRS
ncbi:(deoxy)nucleoside triphosphate pyrophosphohydrolase [Alphaproteobacteria bacterium]|nr:(deoxy)nucleoside triphosphate pyrophosphohydrolase [Alphaproteobacteria bacterium]